MQQNKTYNNSFLIVTYQSDLILKQQGTRHKYTSIQNSSIKTFMEIKKMYLIDSRGKPNGMHL